MNDPSDRQSTLGFHQQLTIVWLLYGVSGISKTTLHKIYNDQSSRIDFDTIDKLCEFLEVEVGDIFEYVASSDVDNTQELNSKKS